MAGIFNKILSRFGYRKVSNNSAFRGAFGGNFWDWIISPTTIDSQIRTSLYRMRANARDLALNNPTARQYLQLLAQNVIGPRGMKLQAQVRNNDGNFNKGINDKIEAGWADFWKSPFVDGKLPGVIGEQMLIKSVARDGEIFVRTVTDRNLNKYAFGLQVIDPDQVDHTFNRPRGHGQNEIRLGIEVNEYGRAMAIWIWTGLPSDVNSGMPRERLRIPAEQIIHVFDPERANQTRGITWFNSVMLPLKHLDGFVEAEVVAARTAACAFPIFEHSEEAPVDEKDKNYQLELNPGNGVALPGGFKLSSWDPKHPVIGVLDFVKACLRFFSSGLTVSYNALANDLEGVNYSSIRSGLLIERDRWRVLQVWWILMFRQPVFEAWLNNALLSGGLALDSRDPRKFQAVKWVPRGWQWVDPLKDVTAAILAIENFLGSRTNYLSEQGDDIEEIVEQLKDELRLVRAAELEQGGVKVGGASPFETDPDEKEGAPGKKPTGKPTALRLAMLTALLDEEDIDEQRIRALLRTYKEAA